MFIEVPNIEKIKNKELFDIIKQEVKSKEAFYYKINNNIIYGFRSKKKSNLLLRKLVRKLFENGEKNFIVLSMNPEETENKIMDIFVSMNKKITTNSYRLELGSFLSIIANNKSSDEEYKIYYIINEDIENMIPNIKELTSIKDDVFTPVEIDFTKDDEKDISKEVSLDDQVKKIKTQLTDINGKYKEKIIEKYSAHKKIVLSLLAISFLGLNSSLIYSYYLDYKEELRQEQIFKEEQEKIKMLARKKLAEQQRLEAEKLKAEAQKKLEEDKSFQEKFIVLLKKNMEIYEFLSLTKELKIDYVNIKNNTMELLLRDKENLKYFSFKDMSIIDNVLILSNIDLIKTLELFKENNKISNNNLDYYKNIIIPEMEEKITKVNENFGSFEKSNGNNVFYFNKNVKLIDMDFVFKNNRHDLNIYMQNQSDNTVKLFVNEDDDIVKKLEDERRKEKERQEKRANTKKMNIK